MLKIILLLLPGFSGLLKEGLEYLWHDKRTTHHKNVRFGICLLLLASSILAVMCEIADQRDTLSRQARADEQINSLRETLLGWETGGDSLPVITYSVVGIYAGKFLIRNHGKYPLHGLSIRVIDRVATNRPAYAFGDTDFEGKRISIPILPPQSIHPLDLADTDFRRTEGVRLKIITQAVNGLFVQYYRDTAGESGFVSALKVEKDGKVVFESPIPEGFPRDERGEAVF